MLPQTCVVVPTYWTRAGGETRPGDAVYDHPTSVDGDSTLPALLESLEGIAASDFYLLVLVAVTADDAAEAAETRVADMLQEYGSFPSLLFGRRQLPGFYDRLSEAGIEESTTFLSLTEYARIRNLQLAIPLALRSEAIVAVDDDEIVTDPEFLTKATQPLGTHLGGHVVDGLSGYYLQDDGGILLHVDPDKANSPNIYDRKAAIMNAATEQLENTPGEIVPTPFCFGGNMQFTSDLAANVGFDPRITRGEDIDYLINARLEGRMFFMRKDLRILHCPPSGGSYKDASWSKLEQDVMRFAYEREKLDLSNSRQDLHPLSVEDLMPYPGEFLSRDTEADAREALAQANYPGDVDRLLEETHTRARAKAEAYLQFRKQWPRAMDVVRHDTSLRDSLMQDIRGL